MISKISNQLLRHSRFLLHPRPLPDELLSSWLVRVAHEHNTEPATFVNLYLPRWRDILWTRDIDVSADRDLLEALGHKSGFDYDTLFNLTLRSYEGYLAENLTTKTRNFFIQAVGNQSRVKIKHGLRYCPLCLKEDEIPYFRKRWRVSFSTACIVHRCFLLDLCQTCGSAVNIHRNNYDSFSPNCHRCGFFFRNAEPEYIYEKSYGFTAVKRLYDILDSGVFRFGDRYTYSFLFFAVLHQLLRIVSCWKLDMAFFDHEAEVKKMSFPVNRERCNYIEDVPLKEQYLLFSGAMKVFEDFPVRYIEFCKLNSLGKTELTRDMKYIPFWYSKVVELFNHESRYVDIEEVKSVIDYLKRNGRNVNLAEVRKLTGACMEYRKREDIKAILTKMDIKGKTAKTHVNHKF